MTARINDIVGKAPWIELERLRPEFRHPVREQWADGYTCAGRYVVTFELEVAHGRARYPGLCNRRGSNARAELAEQAAQYCGQAAAEESGAETRAGSHDGHQVSRQHLLVHELGECSAHAGHTVKREAQIVNDQCYGTVDLLRL